MVLEKQLYIKNSVIFFDRHQQPYLSLHISYTRKKQKKFKSLTSTFLTQQNLSIILFSFRFIDPSIFHQYFTVFQNYIEGNVKLKNWFHVAHYSTNSKTLTQSSFIKFLLLFNYFSVKSICFITNNTKKIPKLFDSTHRNKIIVIL